jgi:hypothetical protein
MYVGKAGAYPTGEQLKITLLGWTPGLSYKYWTWLERPDRDKHYLIDWKGLPGTNTLSYRLARPARNKHYLIGLKGLPETNTLFYRLARPARDKHSSLLQKFAFYGRKSFTTMGPGPRNIYLKTLGKQ